LKNNASDNFPAILSFGQFEALVSRLSQRTGRRFGIPTEAEWEFAARTRRDVNELMEERGLKTMTQLQEWLVSGDGLRVVENFVPLGKGETLSLGSEILTDPRQSRFLERMQEAGGGVCFTSHGTGSGGLNHQEAYYGQAQRGSVKYGPPNARRLHDMTGGMWEWCADVYAENTRNLSQENPFNAPRNSRDDENRVLRGGGWCNLSEDELHAAYRYNLAPDDSSSLISGRVAA